MATVPKPTTAPHEQAIRALVHEWVQHYNARDIDKLVSLYTEDGWLMPPFYPMTQGANAIRQYFAEKFEENDPRDLTVETMHVKVTGDTAFALGTNKENARMPDGKRMDVPGKWTAMLSHVGSHWKLEAHCWNIDVPTQQSAT